MPTDASAFVYDPRPAFREPRSGRAEFLYTMKAASSDAVKVEILDATGGVIRTLDAPSRAGLSRLTWDLRYDGPKQVAFRTTPPDNPHIWEEPRFKGHETRPVIHWGIEGAQVTGPIAVPGKYSARFHIGGQTVTKAFEVIKDPAIDATDAELRASTAMQIRVRDDMNASAEIVNHLEVLRKQIEDALKANAGKADAVQALHALDQKLEAVELRVVSKTDMYSDDKWYVEPYKVYQNLIWFNGAVNSGAGDVAGGADHRPTDASTLILENIERDLGAAKESYRAALDRELASFNRTAAGLGVKPITAEK